MNLTEGRIVRFHPHDATWGGVPGKILDTIEVNGRHGALLAVGRDEETQRVITTVALADELTPA